MYELMNAALPQPQPMVAAAQPAGYPISTRALARMLDVVDYGMLLVVDETHVVFINQIARAELDEDHPLQLLGRDLRVRAPRDVAPLRLALSNAMSRGVQAMVTLGGTVGEGISIAIVPVIEPGEAPAALIVFGKRRVCEELSSDAFARLHGLTLAESRVLKLMCAGYRPGDIARAFDVKLSTVRTQIASIRAKTGSHDIGAVVHRVARLPPLPSVVRHAA